MRRTIWQTRLVIFLMFFAGTQAYAVEVGRLEDLTGGAVPVVSLKGHDTFSNEYIYGVKVINQTGTPIVARTLVLVLYETLDKSGKDVLGNLEVLKPDGNISGKPYFLIPGAAAELPSYQESQEIVVRLRSPDYIPYFAPSFRVLGQRRTATQSLETLIQQLRSKGVLSDAEVQEVLQPSRPPSQ
jgi:hypothetical protein